MKKIVLLIFCLFPLGLYCQEQKTNLLGICSPDDLLKTPYNEWFTKNYNTYQPDSMVMEQLKKTPFNDITITVFFATWCSDTYRELPRFMKVIDGMGFPKQALKLIALSDEEHLYKQTPAHDERGFHIYRVPTFIIFKNGKELNRIVEYPVASLERDLLNILTENDYKYNYFSFSYLSKWYDAGILTDDNVTYAGLANQIKGLPARAGELNNFGYVLSKQGAQGLKAALRVYQINDYLFPKTSMVYAHMAQALAEMGDNDKAEKFLRRAVELNSEPNRADYLLYMYDVVRDRVE